MSEPLRVLVVDDDPLFCHYLATVLSGFGCRVFEAFDGEAALRRLDRLHPDLVILDVVLDGMDGFETLELLKASSPDLPVIILTGHDDIKAAEAKRLGADGFMQKPWMSGEFEVVLHATMQSYALKKAIRARDEAPDGEGDGP